MRTADLALCPAFPLGTHFAWHILNAVVLCVLLHTAMAARPVVSLSPRAGEGRGEGAVSESEVFEMSL